MLSIRDSWGNEYPLLAVKTINKELNGQHDIELNIPQQQNNDLDLKKVDKLWELNYKSVDYKIVYVKQITKGDSFYLNVRGIPLFYFDFDKMIIHQNCDGNYTARNAFELIFSETGYNFELLDFKESIYIEGFGKGETRLEMFKRLIERFEYEFYIIGKTVYMKELVGNDTNFLYKYKLNASNISKSIDASSFFTHIKGFGNFEEGSEDYLKEAKLKREYTSPLAKVVGIYEGKPVVDGRIKDNATMDKNLIKAIDDSLEISIEGNLHDVRSIYAEAIPEIGDRVFLLDDRIVLEQEIRIYTLKTTYDVKDKLTNCDVTFGNRNIRDRYKSTINSTARDLKALLKGDIKLPTWSLNDIARDMISKIHAAESEITFGDFGMMAISKTNPNHVFGLNSEGWYVSTDGGRTARTIATSEGLLADAVLVNNIISHQAFIEDAEVRTLRSTDGLDKFTLSGGKMNWYRSDGYQMDFGIDGLTMKDPNGNTRFEVNSRFVSSSAFGSTTRNVYIAAQNGYEVRIVDVADLPGDGSVDDYIYLPIRTEGVHGDFIGNKTNNSNLYLGTDARVRVTSRSFGVGNVVWRDLEAGGIHAEFVQANTNINPSTLYLRAAGEIRATGLNSTTSYIPIRADGFRGQFIGNSIDNANFYIGTDSRVRVTGRNFGAGTIAWKDLEASGLHSEFIQSNSNIPGQAFYVRAREEVRMTAMNTTESYIPVRALDFYKSSSEKYKEQIKVWPENILNVIKNDVVFYQYKMKQLNSKHFSHGVIIERETPEQWIKGDGVDVSEMVIWALKSIQELALDNDKLKKELKDIKEKIT